MPCTSHHHACECREAQLAATRTAARRVLDVFEILLPTVNVPAHLSPRRLMTELRELVGAEACSVCGEPIQRREDAEILGKAFAHIPCVDRANRLYDEARA